MCKKSAPLFASALAFTGSAVAAPVTPIMLDRGSWTVAGPASSDASGLILVQNRPRGGGAQRYARGGGGAANRGGFNSNEFHQNVSNTRNLNATANRNVNVNANRNVHVNGGGCCYGNYNSGPSWGGVAAGVAVGAVVGAAVNSAASSPTYVVPPPTYPPGYVSPPPY
jgi:hypothetical protein